MRRVYDFSIGDVVDDLELIDFRYVNHQKKFTCKCKVCGREKDLVEACLGLHKGTTHRACGKGLKTKDKKFYNTWQGLKHRIYNENYHHYNRYDGRGLTTDYDNFIDFYDDMYESYLKAKKKLGDKISIDRIENDKGYVRGNLRWANQKTQVNNSSKMRKLKGISPDGTVYKFKNMRDFAKEHGLSSKQIQAVASGRFKTTKGWKFEYIDNR